MYNLLIGPPGGGKSYEAVVFHVLPTLESGRKIITNLPLNVAEFANIDQRFPSLIELRTKTKATVPVDVENPVSRYGAFRVKGKTQSDFIPHAFANIEDYGDDWRDKDTGVGALYIIDEAHKALPRGATARKVEEWFAEHRHEGADVLLITQSYGKISKAITDSAQVVYRVKKMTAFGNSKAYIRKVQDGVRGDVLSVAERVYDKKYYRYYKSHTRSVGAVLEADAKDISPLFLKWKRASYVFMSIAAVMFAFKAYGFVTGNKKHDAGKNRARTEEHTISSSASKNAPVSTKPAGPAISKTKRIVGVYVDGSQSILMIHTQESDYREEFKNCVKKVSGWSCLIDGETVTEYTGPAPHNDGQPGFMSVGGLLASQSSI